MVGGKVGLGELKIIQLRGLARVISQPKALVNSMTNLDELHMREALDLARAGLALTSPNPCVGAVIVDDAGKVAGSGSHTYDGLKHAETLAIEQAGIEGARRNTLCESGTLLSSGTHTALRKCHSFGRHQASCRSNGRSKSARSWARFRSIARCGSAGRSWNTKGEAQKLNEAFAR